MKFIFRYCLWKVWYLVFFSLRQDERRTVGICKQVLRRIFEPRAMYCRGMVEIM